MKELTIEQKAQAYDEVLNRAKECHIDGLSLHQPVKEVIEHIFPVLKESEDEKIRKCIISSLNALLYTKGSQADKERNDAIAWLEKQNSNIDNANKEYWRGYREGKQEILDKYAELEKQGEQNMIPLDKVIKFLDEQLINDKDEVTGESFINFQNYGAFKETFISYFKRKMLEKQGEPVEINPTEFDTRLQALIGEFDGLPKEELIGSLSFWLNVVQNDGTYEDKKSKCKQKLVEKYNIKDIGSKNAQGKLGEMIKNLNLADKAEPKFKVGDWITDGNITIQIEAIENNCYLYYGDCALYSTKTADKVYHLWTIKDAKNGDVLAVEPRNDYPSPFIAIYKERGLDYFNSYCFIGFDAKFYTGDTGHDIIGIHPATKEQRDALERAMTDAGYTFDFEKKELKKNMLY